MFVNLHLNQTTIEFSCIFVYKSNFPATHQHGKQHQQIEFIKRFSHNTNRNPTHCVRLVSWVALSELWIDYRLNYSQEDGVLLRSGEVAMKCATKHCRILRKSLSTSQTLCLGLLFVSLNKPNYRLCIVCVCVLYMTESVALVADVDYWLPY